MPKCDILLVIPLNDEFRVIKDNSKINYKESYEGLYFFHLKVQELEDTIVSIVLGTSGPTSTSQIIERALRYWTPKMIILIGIAGAISDDLKLGDIVIANEVDEYLADSAAESTGNSFEIKLSGKHWRLSEPMINSLRNFEHLDEVGYLSWKDKAKSYQNSLKIPKELKQYYNSLPELFFGHIASGNIVSKAKSFKKKLLANDRKFEVIEEEAAGVLQVTESMELNKPLVLIIRGISDFADEEKNVLEGRAKGKIRKYATFNAFIFLQKALQLDYFRGYLNKKSKFKQIPKDVSNYLKDKFLNITKNASIEINQKKYFSDFSGSFNKKRYYIFLLGNDISSIELQNINKIYRFLRDKKDLSLEVILLNQLNQNSLNIPDEFINRDFIE